MCARTIYFPSHPDLHVRKETDSGEFFYPQHNIRIWFHFLAISDEDVDVSKDVGASGTDVPHGGTLVDIIAQVLLLGIFVARCILIRSVDVLAGRAVRILQ